MSIKKLKKVLGKYANRIGSFAERLSEVSPDERLSNFEKLKSDAISEFANVVSKQLTFTDGSRSLKDQQFLERMFARPEFVVVDITPPFQLDYEDIHDEAVFASMSIKVQERIEAACNIIKR